MVLFKRIIKKSILNRLIDEDRVNVTVMLEYLARISAKAPGASDLIVRAAEKKLTKNDKKWLGFAASVAMLELFGMGAVSKLGAMAIDAVARLFGGR